MPGEVKLLPCPFCGREPISTDHGALVFHQIAPCPLSKQHFDARIWATRPTLVTDEVVEQLVNIGDELLAHAANGRPGMIADLVGRWEAAKVAAMPTIVQDGGVPAEEK